MVEHIQNSWTSDAQWAYLLAGCTGQTPAHVVKAWQVDIRIVHLSHWHCLSIFAVTSGIRQGQHGSLPPLTHVINLAGWQKLATCHP